MLTFVAKTFAISALIATGLIFIRDVIRKKAEIRPLDLFLLNAVLFLMLSI